MCTIFKINSTTFSPIFVTTRINLLTDENRRVIFKEVDGLISQFIHYLISLQLHALIAAFYDEDCNFLVDILNRKNMEKKSFRILILNFFNGSEISLASIFLVSIIGLHMIY